MGEVILVFMEKVEDEPNAFIVQFEGTTEDFLESLYLGGYVGALHVTEITPIPRKKK